MGMKELDRRPKLAGRGEPFNTLSLNGCCSGLAKQRQGHSDAQRREQARRLVHEHGFSLRV